MASPRKKSMLASKLGKFVQEYERKAQKGWDPNDRGYDRKVENVIKRLPAEELSELMSGGVGRTVPISQTELEALLIEQLQRCSPEQRKLFEIHRVQPYQVPIHRFGNTESVFAVAQFSEGLLYYEDIEEGFELAALGEDGAIQEPGCNQYELTHVLHQLGL